MTIAYIGLGANLGDPVAAIAGALDALARLPQTTLVAASSLYRTAPLGLADQSDYINAVAAIDTDLAPRALLDSLLAIEFAFGRRRSVANAPRSLDLDLLLQGSLVVGEATLQIPHPRLHERAFVLVPLLEIAPDCYIPGRGYARDRLGYVLHGQRVRRLRAGERYCPDPPSVGGPLPPGPLPGARGESFPLSRRCQAI